MNNYGTFTALRPHGLLRHLFSCFDTTCLQAFSNSVNWLIYLEDGAITYATHSVEPFDRLERHLRRLNPQIPQITNEIRVQLRLLFETELQNQLIYQPPEYQAIHWLIDQGHLDTTQATVLIQELVKDVIESFLLIKTGIYELSDTQQKLPPICRLDISKVIERCQMRLQHWQSCVPQITSPYQRPYLLINGKNSPALQPQLTHWMKGFSLRHLAIIMNQDEIQLAQNLYPYILTGEIILHEPDPPFDQLPKIPTKLTSTPQYTTELLHKTLVDTVVELSSHANPITPILAIDNLAPVVRSPQTSTPAKAVSVQELTLSNTTNPHPERVTAITRTTQQVYKIVSVDDSPTILKEISHFLESENFNVVAINDPLKAAMSIIRHKPDLILLDLNMAGIDGYELCRIIRNNSLFKNTPIIFVTGYKGLVDKVKARLVGASGYLTKPFTRAELLKMVFMHLT